MGHSKKFPFGRAFIALMVVNVLFYSASIAAQDLSAVPRVVKFSGVAPAGASSATFAIYDKEDSLAPLWLETQSVTADETGHYTVLLGSTRIGGLPASIFSSGEARWIGVKVGDTPEGTRALLVSVPYALKAGDAETLGGKPLSAFLMADSVANSNNLKATRLAGMSAPTPESSRANPESSAALQTTGGTAQHLVRFVDPANVDSSLVVDTGAAVGVGVVPDTHALLEVAGNLAVFSGGKIGVGTTTPQANLDLQASDNANTFLGRRGNGNVVHNMFIDSAGNGGFQVRNAGEVTNVQLYPGGASYFINHNVGIGTTSPRTPLEVAANLSVTTGGRIGVGTISPQASLDLVGADNSNIFLGRRPNGIVVHNMFTDNTGTGGFQIRNGSEVTQIQLYPRAVSYFLNHNVGFGTSTPQATVDVNGNLNLSATTSATNGVFTVNSIRFIHSFGGNNTFLGSNAGNFTMTGLGGNTGIGASALSGNVTGISNTAVGRNALASNTSGITNVALGFNALGMNTTGGSNVAIGNAAGVSSNGANANISGTLNTFIGFASGPGTTTQLTNATAIGSNALVSQSNSIVLGDGTVKVGIGTQTPTQALDVVGTVNATNFTGSAFGLTNLGVASGLANTAIGSGALSGTGVGNTAVGKNALTANTTGPDNVGIGLNALGSNTTGANNIGIGNAAGVTSTAANANTTGSNNTFIGFASGPGTSTQLSNATAIGANALVSQNNSIVLGDGTVNVGIGISTPAATLDVNGNIHTTGTVFFADGGQQSAAGVSQVIPNEGLITQPITNRLSVGLQPCAPQQVLQSAGGSWNCASVVTSITATPGGGTEVTGPPSAPFIGLLTTCTQSQVLTWSGSAWQCTTPAGSGGVTLPFAGSTSSASGAFAVTQTNSVVIGNPTFQQATSSIPGGVVGTSSATTNTAAGIAGFANSPGAVAVLGWNGATNATGSNGSHSTGVLGRSDDPNGVAIQAENDAASGNAIGLKANVQSATGIAIDASAPSGALAGNFNGAVSVNGNLQVQGVVTSNSGPLTINSAVNLASSISGPTASISNISVANISSGGAQPVFINGDLTVSGNLSKSTGTFKIDHPLDPAGKFLYHSFVESPDMMNIYNGVVTLDAKGQAWITMPDYFEALNMDFRYQLTAIGHPAPNLYVKREMAANKFLVSGGPAHGKVSWQVTGIRHDAFANAHRVQVEVEKPAAEQGTYLHPELFTKSASDKIAAVNSQR